MQLGGCMNSYKISIIIPIFNAEKYLKKCLNSIQSQSLDDIEIICIDDGSNDNSLSILKEYAKDDNRFKIYVEENKGPGAARNYGIKKAKGNYILFVDSDDWIEKNTLEEIYKTAINNKSDIVLFNSIEFRPNNTQHKRVYINNKKTDYAHFSFNYKYDKKLVMNSYLTIWSKLHRTDFLRENNILFFESNLFEDVLFHIQTMIKAKNISYNPNFYYNYRRTELNTRQNNSIKSKNNLMIFDIFKEIEELLIENNVMHDLEINYFIFKLTEMENIINNTNDKYKDESLNKIKNNLNEKQIPERVLKNLPENNKLFLEKSIFSDNYVDFLLFEKLKNNEKFLDEALLNKINNYMEIYVKKNIKINPLIVELLVQSNLYYIRKHEELNEKNNKIIESSTWKITTYLRKLKKKL